jgi:hypothetical protein
VDPSKTSARTSSRAPRTRQRQRQFEQEEAGELQELFGLNLQDLQEGVFVFAHVRVYVHVHVLGHTPFLRISVMHFITPT